MADAVVVTVLAQDNNFYVVQLTNLSDGTGESAVKKVDVSALSPASVKVRIDRVIWSNVGMGVKLLWDATTNTPAIELTANTEGDLDFSKFGGLKNTAGSGVTGDILLTTVGHTAADTYLVVLVCRKTPA